MTNGSFPFFLQIQNSNLSSYSIRCRFKIYCTCVPNYLDCMLWYIRLTEYHQYPGQSRAAKPRVTARTCHAIYILHVKHRERSPLVNFKIGNPVRCSTTCTLFVPNYLDCSDNSSNWISRVPRAIASGEAASHGNCVLRYLYSAHEASRTQSTSINNYYYGHMLWKKEIYDARNPMAFLPLIRFLAKTVVRL